MFVSVGGRTFFLAFFFFSFNDFGKIEAALTFMLLVNELKLLVNLTNTDYQFG